MAMSCSQLATLVGAPGGPTVVDVRSRREFARGHVPGAVHVPFWRAGAGTARALPAPRDGGVVVYCGRGPRAWWAAYRLRRAGVAHVDCLAGHMRGWRLAGYEEESGTR
jgi:rhodanese-related sulfurtransferase